MKDAQVLTKEEMVHIREQWAPIVHRWSELYIWFYATAIDHFTALGCKTDDADRYAKEVARFSMTKLDPGLRLRL